MAADDLDLSEWPDGLLWLELLNRSKLVAAELGITPAAWMHQQVDIWIRADRSVEQEKRRGGLHIVP